MVEIDDKVIKKLVKKHMKSKHQNCFQCRFFPYNYGKIMINKYYLSIGWSWGVENIEKLNFNCQYLKKRVSQATKPVRTNSCLCFERCK